jgi:cyclophilin family peptidyl-prolyl cis-trans isomerase
LAFAVSLSLIPAALGSPTVAQDAEPAPPAATPNPVAIDKPSGDGTGIRLETDLGDIVIGLFNESAPVAAENFLNLVESGYYDGTGFHRVVRDFVIQGGDPEGTGRGGPGYTIEDEDVVGQYGRGIVAMARTQAPNSQGSQFFVVLDDAAEAPLESARTYVIFGRVLEGMDVVDAIAAQGPAADFIEDPVRIITASVEQVDLPEEPDPPTPSAAEVAADALTALVPDTLAGLPMETTTASSDQILLRSGQDAAILALASAAAANGTELAALAIVNAGGTEGEVSIVLAAASLPGVPASETQASFRDLLLPAAGENAEITTESIAGHDVTLVKAAPDSGWRDSIHIVASGDVVWFIVTDFDTVEQVIDELPIDQS